MNSVEHLKNALLTFVLLSENRKDFDKSFEYGKYTGTKLPPLSGSSLEEAVFSYIVDKEEFKTSPMYSDAMLKKSIAIDAYIHKHLNTDKKVLKLLKSFLKKQAIE